MVKKKAKKAKKKTESWDSIGKKIGKKMEAHFKGCSPMDKNNWCLSKNENGGGFGRLLFALGVIFALNSVGLLAGVPWWALTLIALGFTLMKF
ncbi:hypothetical protein ACFL1H_02050 [Nanoarchaeota archaeon]